MKNHAKIGLILAILLAMLLFGVAMQRAPEQAPALEDKMVIWFLVIVCLGTVAHAFGGLVQKWTGLSEMIGWLVLGIGLTNVPGVRQVTHQCLIDPRYDIEHVVEIVGQLGIWILLTEAGLETELKMLIKNVGRGGAIATIGVIVPGVVVYLVLPLIFPNLSQIGRALTAAIFTPTSLGVSVIFFKESRILSSGTAQLVMAVAAIDDVIGLLILTGLLGMLTGTGGAAALAMILLKAMVFFAATLTAGATLTPYISRFMARMNDGEAMRLKIALASATIFAWIARQWGLSPLMGAYAGGVFLTEVHFKEFNGSDVEHGVEYLLRGMKYIVVPIFVMSVAMKVDLRLFVAVRPIALLVVGLVGLVVGKLIASTLAGSGNDQATLAWGAVPRGEVALVIAGMGFSRQLIGPDIMSVAVMAMVGSILLTSWRLPHALRRATIRNARIFDPVT